MFGEIVHIVSTGQEISLYEKKDQSCIGTLQSVPFSNMVLKHESIQTRRCDEHDRDLVEDETQAK